MNPGFQTILDEIESLYRHQSMFYQELVQNHPNLCQFFDSYQPSILKKFRNAHDEEKKRDIIAELNVVCLIAMANNRLQIQRGPNVNSSKKNPEFKLISKNEEYYCEVKRLRDSPQTLTMFDAYKELEEEIKKTHSGLGFQLTNPDIGYTEDYAEKFHRALPQLIHEARHQISKAGKSLSKGGSIEYTFSSFPDLMLILIDLPEKPEDSPTSHFGGAQPVLYRQNEHLKIRSRIIQAAQQLEQNEIGIVFLQNDSETVEEFDLYYAMKSICEVANRTIQYRPIEKIESLDEYRSIVARVSEIVLYRFVPGRLEVIENISNPLAHKKSNKALHDLISKFPKVRPFI
ncbi:MAG: hypothetical protein HUJ26_08385 [Planctomycetaceae bacterium]|nr:hypothetical protein [Planctomycetaceae bacterium]